MAKAKNFTQDPNKILISGATDPAAEDPIREAPTVLETEVDLNSFQVPKGYRLVKESKSARLQTLTRPAVAKAISAEAKKQKKSINSLVNDVLEEYLRERGYNEV